MVAKTSQKSPEKNTLTEARALALVVVIRCTGVAKPGPLALGRARHGQPDPLVPVTQGSALGSVRECPSRVGRGRQVALSLLPDLVLRVQGCRAAHPDAVAEGAVEGQIQGRDHAERQVQR
jgi:hypothetical protein